MAVADPGGSHSNRGSGFDRGSGGGNGRGGSERHDRDRVGNIDGGKRGEVEDGPGIVESPTVRVGSGRADVAEAAPRTAADSGETVSSGTGPGLFNGSGPTLSSGGGSGSARAGVPSVRVGPPPVTVGNGREPGIKKGTPEPQWRAPALPEPVPVAPPPPPPAAPAPPPPAEVKMNPIQPVQTQRLDVAEVDDWQNPWWGLAGLLLIPCAGAALGYRQARAAHAAERLRRF